MTRLGSNRTARRTPDERTSRGNTNEGRVSAGIKDKPERSSRLALELNTSQSKKYWLTSQRTSFVIREL